MPTTLRATIQFANINFDGVNCSECDQIAFMVAKVIGEGIVYELPLCGRHYIEAQRMLTIDGHTSHLGSLGEDNGLQ
jgi:hypothetical protein